MRYRQIGKALSTSSASPLSSRAWHDSGMSRTRLSTTVDQQLLDTVRRARSGLTDAALIDEALQALLDRLRATEINTSYEAYDAHPMNEPDDWGDLDSFRRSAAAT